MFDIKVEKKHTYKEKVDLLELKHILIFYGIVLSKLFLTNIISNIASDLILIKYDIL